jgi:superfamily II RNA helicase
MLYISFNGELTEKGQFARRIYFQELLITELFLTNLYKKLSDTELLQVIAGIIYEPRKNDHFSFLGVQRKYKLLLRKLQENPFIIKKLNKLSLKRMMALVGSWSEGSDFDELMSLTMIGEGDIIRLFRRVIDMIGQIRNATLDYELKERLDKCQNNIDRGLVAIEL